jgi:hypothetical protein
MRLSQLENSLDTKGRISMRKRRLWWAVGTVLTLTAASFANAEAPLRWVSNRGIDTPSCGNTTDNACRSISQAIENAVEGEVIAVLAGHYGDLNADGDLDDPGEEHLQPTAPASAIYVSKRVTVMSKGGAEQTVIDIPQLVNPSVPEQLAVYIDAAGAVFGTPGHGFTIKGGSTTGQVQLRAYAPNFQVSGNIIVGGVFQLIPSQGQTLISDNTAVGGEGYNVFIFRLGVQPRIVTLRDNKAIGTAFVIDGDEVQVIHNKATGSDKPGFLLIGASIVAKDNFASDNAIGFMVGTIGAEGPLMLLTGNSAIGNRGPGILVGYEARVGIHGNNFYSNDTNGASNVIPPHTGTNCGVFRLTQPAQYPVVDATGNYWGSARGPGADPADNTGFDAGCDADRKLVFKPWATAPFPITP